MFAKFYSPLQINIRQDERICRKYQDDEEKTRENNEPLEESFSK